MQQNFKIISDTIIPGQKNMWLCKDHLLWNYFPSIKIFLCTVYFGSNLRIWRSWDSYEAKKFTMLGVGLCVTSSTAIYDWVIKPLK